MALTESYLTSYKNLEAFLKAIKTARAPERFTVKLLEDLGFKYSSDRLLIPMLKALRFLDENGVPTQRYFDYLDDSQSAKILAQGIEDAYEDLFKLNTRAYKMSKAEVVGKLRSLTEGKKSEDILNKMANTFLELAKLANFSTKPNVDEDKPSIEDETESSETEDYVDAVSTKNNQNGRNKFDLSLRTTNERLIDAITYRIEINLPSSRDKAVYDAIFRSIKEHLL